MERPLSEGVGEQRGGVHGSSGEEGGGGAFCFSFLFGLGGERHSMRARRLPRQRLHIGCGHGTAWDTLLTRRKVGCGGVGCGACGETGVCITYAVRDVVFVYLFSVPGQLPRALTQWGSRLLAAVEEARGDTHGCPLPGRGRTLKATTVQKAGHPTATQHPPPIPPLPHCLEARCEVRRPPPPLPSPRTLTRTRTSPARGPWTARTRAPPRG